MGGSGILRGRRALGARNKREGGVGWGGMGWVKPCLWSCAARVHHKAMCAVIIAGGRARASRHVICVRPHRSFRLAGARRRPAGLGRRGGA